LIGFEAHELGTVRAIVNNDPSILLAAVATHAVSVELQIAKPAQQTCTRVHVRD
jgi:hypothetical protein